MTEINITSTKLNSILKIDDNPKLLISFTCGQGSCRGGNKSVRRFIKDDYVGRRFKIDIEKRTEIVQLFMKALKKVEPNDWRIASSVRQFLTRFHLSNAEIHAVLFHVGFRYSTSGGAARGNRNLRNIQINGYYDHGGLCVSKTQEVSLAKEPSLRKTIRKKGKTLPEIEREYLDFIHKDENIRSQQKRRDEFNKIRWVRETP